MKCFEAQRATLTHFLCIFLCSCSFVGVFSPVFHASAAPPHLANSDLIQFCDDGDGDGNGVGDDGYGFMTTRSLTILLLCCVFLSTVFPPL